MNPSVFSRYLPYRCRRKLSIIFVFKKLAGAPFSQRKGGWGLRPPFVHFALLLGTEGIPTKFSKKESEIFKRCSRQIVQSKIPTVIPIPKYRIPKEVSVGIYRYRPGGGKESVYNTINYVESHEYFGGKDLANNRNKVQRGRYLLFVRVGWGAQSTTQGSIFNSSVSIIWDLQHVLIPTWTVFFAPPVDF